MEEKITLSESQIKEIKWGFYKKLEKFVDKELADKCRELGSKITLNNLEDDMEDFSESFIDNLIENLES